MRVHDKVDAETKRSPSFRPAGLNAHQLSSSRRSVNARVRLAANEPLVRPPRRCQVGQRDECGCRWPSRRY